MCMFLNTFCRRKLKIAEADVTIVKKMRKLNKTKYKNVRLSDVRMLEWMHCGSHTWKILHFTFWRHVLHKAPIY